MLLTEVIFVGNGGRWKRRASLQKEIVQEVVNAVVDTAAEAAIVTVAEAIAAEVAIDGHGMTGGTGTAAEAADGEGEVVIGEEVV